MYKNTSHQPKQYFESRNTDLKKCTKWTLADEEKLIQLMKKCESADINWQDITKQLGNKTVWSCYNKYLQLNDPKWTPKEENTLGLFWEKNRSRPGFNISEADKLLPKHKSKMIKFKLEQLTRWGRFRPKFWIDGEDLKSIK